MLMSLADVSLLCDPWLSGTAFSGGWGLRYDNPDAMARAAMASHLWISHWHSDHLHVPTLNALAIRAPGMTVLANVSHNFSMVERLGACGFRNVVPIAERVPLAISARVTATRYPTAGIDNMLHVVGDGFSVLNYNDCNLPVAAARAIRAKTGPIDVLLSNYNHAGKLFTRDGDEAIKQAYFDTLLRAASAFDPKTVIPFASSHAYRTDVSRAQNSSHMDFDELAARTENDPRFAVLRIGDVLTIEDGVRWHTARTPACLQNKLDLHDYGAPIERDALTQLVRTRCEELARRFPIVARLCPPLDVRVRDLDDVLRMRLGRAPEWLGAKASADIVASSRAIADWHGRVFGDDTFFAGAHFDMEREDARAIRMWALVTLLEASHLDPKSVFGALASTSGRAFFWNRREEVWATLAARKVRAGELRG
jgi:L-ascorbate metabolism protein UlaG (beta-lactamase superfamily)